MKVSQKKLVKFGTAIALTIVVLTLWLAPQSNRVSNGSTYGRSPDGYSAWYAFMSDRGNPVDRWQKPITQLEEKYSSNNNTLLIVSPDLTQPEALPISWVERGNYLVILGDKQPPTAANFTKFFSYESASIIIETTRRKLGKEDRVSTPVIKDEFGSVIWREQVGKGNIIYSSTPYLAANAYQNFSGNYELLAKLTANAGGKVLVDEYIHGYKDAETLAIEAGKSLTDYLAKTPLLPVFIQLAIALLIAIAASNFRFGQPENLATVTLDNSEAYIQALGGVLQKAETTNFVRETISKAQQKKLQRNLGLGSDIISEERLIEAWKEQTGKPESELKQLLSTDKKKKIEEGELEAWLAKWQEIDRYFAS